MPPEPFEMPAPLAFSEAVRYYRTKRGLNQRELANLLGIRPGPMSNIECGRHYPSFTLLCTLTRALGITIDELLRRAQFIAEATQSAPEDHVRTETISPCSAAEEYPFAGLTHPPDLTAKRCSLLNRHLYRITQAYLELEKLCALSGFATLPLMIPVEQSERGAQALARQVRAHLSIGDAMVYDYPLLLENHGLRVMQIKMPYGIASLSCSDPARLNAFIFLREDLPAERRLFLLIQELGWLYLTNAIRYGLQLKPCASSRHLSADKFTRHFAACFLMPEDALRAAFFRTGLHAEIFDLDMLLTLKARFGVSAQMFSYRLTEIGLLPAAQASAFREALDHLYSKDRKEPGRTRQDWQNGRLNDLIAVARRRSAPQHHQPIFDALATEFRAEDE